MRKKSGNSEQMKISESKQVEVVLSGEELDKALYDVMNTLWRSYRESVQAKNYKTYNGCFEVLYSRYTDRGVVRFIESMGMGLVNALNRRVKNDE